MESSHWLLRPPGNESVITLPDAILTEKRPVEVPTPVTQKIRRPSGDQIGVEKSRSSASSRMRASPPLDGTRYSLLCIELFDA